MKRYLLVKELGIRHLPMDEIEYYEKARPQLAWVRVAFAHGGEGINGYRYSQRQKPRIVWRGKR